MEAASPKILKRELDVSEGRGETATDGQCCPVIGINFCESTPLVWHAAEVKAAREEGIIGSLVGSLARQPRQNSRLGRPLELMLEEGRLLTEIGKAARIRPIDPLKEDREVSLERVERYHAELENNFEEQKVMALEDRKTVLQRVMSEKQNTDSESDVSIRDRLDALEQGFSFPRSAMAVQLCTARAGLQYGPEEGGFLAARWPLPQDEKSETRLHVFRDLRRRGFFLTSAGKFGGDYLVYPGDPLRFHAHFIAVCLSMDESMSLCDILAIARLGSNVKKTVVLCSPGGGREDDSEEVVYTSLQWSGMI